MGKFVRRVTVIRPRGETSEVVTADRESQVVRRITVIQRGSNEIQATVYRQRRRRPRVSLWTLPLERMATQLARAQIVYSREILRRHDESNRRRRDGWVMEAPANWAESARRAYNEARKAGPFRILPKV
jgi:hypothetical protein